MGSNELKLFFSTKILYIGFGKKGKILITTDNTYSKSTIKIFDSCCSSVFIFDFGQEHANWTIYKFTVSPAIINIF